MAKIIGVSNGVMLQREGATILVNGEKYAAYIACSDGAQAILTFHPPEPRHKVRGIGFIFPLAFFTWWFKQAATHELIAQDKQTECRYHFRPDVKEPVTHIRRGETVYVFIGLQHFKAKSGAGYIKPPRRKAKRRHATT